jgi:hypothetical protein
MLNYDYEDSEISGSAAELAALARAIAGAAESDAFSFDSDEFPFLVVRSAAGKVVIRCEPEHVTMVGAPEKLLVVAENIGWVANQKASQGILEPHLHLEHVTDHPIFDASSQPLIVTLRET